jgi:cytochrome c553
MRADFAGAIQTSTARASRSASFNTLESFRMKMKLPRAALIALLPLAAAAQGTPGDAGKSGAAMSAAPKAVNVSMCTGCHTIPGYQASFPRVYRVPMISGQSAKYLEGALQAYRKGDRSHPTMRAIAQGLDDAEIAALAAYYSARGGDAAK